MPPFVTSYLILLILVLVRTSGIMLFAPVFGTSETPPTVKALLALAISVLIVPVQSVANVPLPTTLIDLAAMLVGETMIGLTLGLGIMILFSAFQLTGQMIGQLSGMSLGDVYNPSFNDSMPLLSNFLYLTTLAAYMLIGGHRLLMAGLLDSFQAIPPGMAVMPEGGERLLVNLFTESFELGIRAAAPASVALLLATIVLGLVSRSLPQLNILALGFGFNAIVTFSVLSITVGSACWLLQERLEPTIDLLLETLVPTASPHPAN
jgi:flagellar biosynthetic protein FliR